MYSLFGTFFTTERTTIGPFSDECVVDISAS